MTDKSDEITIVGITHLFFFNTPLSGTLLVVTLVLSSTGIVALLAYPAGVDSNAYKMYIK